MDDFLHFRSINNQEKVETSVEKFIHLEGQELFLTWG